MTARRESHTCICRASSKASGVGGLEGLGRDVDDKNRVEVHLHFTHSLIANELSVADFRKRRTTEAGALCISSVDGDDLRMMINNSISLAEFDHPRSHVRQAYVLDFF